MATFAALLALALAAYAPAPHERHGAVAGSLAGVRLQQHQVKPDDLDDERVAVEPADPAPAAAYAETWLRAKHAKPWLRSRNADFKLEPIQDVPLASSAEDGPAYAEPWSRSHREPTMLASASVEAGQEDPTQDSPLTPAQGLKASPLGVGVGAELSEKMLSEKAASNAKRESVRGVTAWLLPGAVAVALAAVQLSGGRDALKELEANLPNPFDNAPGMEQAKRQTAAQQDRKAELLDALRSTVAEPALE